MAFSNPLSNMFGQSPIKPMEQHMAVAVNTARHLQAFFDAVVANDWDSAEAVQKEIGTLENEADVLKKELRLHLPKSLFLPVPRSDLLELLTMQDKIANRAKDIAGIMLGRKMAIPADMVDTMQSFVASAIATAEQALVAIDELHDLLESGFSGRELKIVENLIEELDALEKKSDGIEITIRSSLFKLEADLPPVDVMFLYKVIDWVGDLADCSQAVGSRLQLLLAR
jgi:predicted phosphate transport protein (TIGR00153 family)